jgi:hypothetical protein
LSSDNDTQSALTPMCVECSGIDEDNSMYVFAKSHLNELVFVSIRVSTEDDLLIEIEDYFFRNITTLSPLSFLVQNESYFSDKHSIVQLIVNNHDENTKDVCMMISIQVSQSHIYKTLIVIKKISLLNLLTKTYIEFVFNNDLVI